MPLPAGGFGTFTPVQARQSPAPIRRSFEKFFDGHPPLPFSPAIFKVAQVQSGRAPYPPKASAAQVAGDRRQVSYLHRAERRRPLRQDRELILYNR